VRRATVKFANLDIEFTDRDRAIGQVAEWGGEGTLRPVVIFGPEGCGKTAFLRQAATMLRDLGYDAIYVDVARMDFVAHTDVADVAKRLIDAAAETSGVAQLKRGHGQVRIPMGRPAATREGSRTRHREIPSLADAHIQRSGEKGAEGGDASAAASTCGF